MIDLLEQAKDKMSKARTRLVTGHPFFGNCAMKLKLIPDPTTETMATNGEIIKYNPQFVVDMLMIETVGVLAHEIMHVTNGHHLRRNVGIERNPTLWNIATDYSINASLVKGGFNLPEGGLLDPIYENKCAEIIYKLLLDDYKESEESNESEDGEGSEGSDDGEGSEGSNESDDGEGSDESKESDGEGSEGSEGSQSIEDYVEENFGKQAGEVFDKTADNGKDLTESEIERELEELTVENIQAEMRAKGRGFDSSNMTTDLKGYVEDKTNWKDVLLMLCQDSLLTDYSYAKPNRRFIAEDVYLPSLESDGVSTLVIGVDQSGSVDDQCVSLFEGVMQNVVNQVSFEKIYIVYFTHDIEEVVEIDSADEFKMKSTRYSGGTIFNSVTEWIEDEGITPSCLLMLTDGEARLPPQPDYPIGWCLTPNYSSWGFNEVSGYGEIIELEF